jgi:hypothetical protein
LANQGKCAIQSVVTKDRRYADDLPTIVISRLRAEGVITAETTEFVVRLGEVEKTVGVKARRFPNGGAWSSFVSPCCGVQVRVLKLLNGGLLCCRCCRSRGVLYRCEPTGLRQRASRRVPKLLAMLESDKPLRLKPSTMRGKMEKRERHEAALQRNLLILRRYELAALSKAKG